VCERHFCAANDEKQLDHTLREASRPHIGGGISTTHWGRHLDHSPMGGISRRQSESMTGSIDLLSASRSLKARGISIARRREAFHSAVSGGKPRQLVGISIACRREALLLLCLCFVLFVGGCEVVYVE
jgi:hypothetical protein